LAPGSPAKNRGSNKHLFYLTPPPVRTAAASARHQVSNPGDFAVSLIFRIFPRKSDLPCRIFGWDWVLTEQDQDCGDWLARGYMPAHQHCEVYYPQALSATKWACGKRRAFSPGANAFHSPSVRTHSDFRTKKLFVGFFWIEPTR